MRPSSVIAVCLMLLLVIACTPEPAGPGPSDQLPSAQPAPVAQKAQQPVAPTKELPLMSEQLPVEPVPVAEPLDLDDTLSLSIDDLQYDVKVT